MRNGAKAVELAQLANKLSGNANAVGFRTLAAAYAEAGQFSNAVKAAQRALQLATSQNNISLLNELQAQVGCYQTNTPFRDAMQIRNH